MPVLLMSSLARLPEVYCNFPWNSQGPSVCDTVGRIAWTPGNPGEALLGELDALGLEHRKRGGESVDIVRFLMSIKDPSAAVVESIESAVKWFERSELKGVKWVKKPDATQPGGFDCVVVKDPESSIWARFYEIGTNRPIFAGRDGVLKYDVTQIEHERRTGYEWYVDGAAKLLKKDYPAWKKRHVVTTRVH